jgi:hypothetical protein
MQMPAVDLNASSLAGMRALLESIFYNKNLVAEQSVMQVFTDQVRNNDAYTIQRTLAGLATPQFEDAKLASIRLPTSVVWGATGRINSGSKRREASRRYFRGEAGGV